MNGGNESKVVLIVHRRADVVRYSATERRWPRGCRRTVMVEMDKEMSEEDRNEINEILGENFQIVIYDPLNNRWYSTSRIKKDWWSLSLLALMAVDLTCYKYSEEISESYHKMLYLWAMAAKAYKGYIAVSSTLKSVKVTFGGAKEYAKGIFKWT